MGKPIVMGRLTFESIGKALPGRTNIVITRRSDFRADGCVIVASVDEAFAAAEPAPEVMVIGGADLFRQTLPRADIVYLTRVHAQIAGDAFFPELVPDEWIERDSEYHSADERHSHAFTFLKLVRSHVL